MAVGVEDQVTFCVRDAFLRSEEGQYHLVYWDNSLHHMMDVDDALSWSKACLRPGDDSGTFNRLISCPTPDKIIALDPSVAAGSSRAIPALNKYFPGATISPTDGAIYRIGFAGLYGSMDMSDQYDRSVIDWTLLVGEVLMKQEMTHYTFAVCQV